MVARLVLDTNVVISGLLWRGPPYQLLKAASNGTFSAFTSLPLLDELSRTLSAPKFKRILDSAGYTQYQLRDVYESFSRIIVPASIDEVIVVADPSDDVVVRTALAANADSIVTGNHHLLDLVSYGKIPILTPSRFLQLLNSQSCADLRSSIEKKIGL
jgi:putative PIN family toxin of toxin-antitoxin system